MPRVKTQEQFLEEIKHIHGDEYDYSKVIYKNNRIPIIVVCKIHGEFYPSPGNHIRGSKCLKCATQRTADRLRLSMDDFRERSYIVHGDKYGYDDVQYHNIDTNVNIYCFAHKEFFQQTPYNHLKGHGCSKCGYENMERTSTKWSNDKYIERAMSIHGDKYDYSETIYDGMDKKIIIKCKTHGKFEQNAGKHLNGIECCKHCYNSSRTLPMEEFLHRAKEIHNDEYGYESVHYSNMKERIIIICKVHGEFPQSVESHLNGSGCPGCSAFKSEKICREIIEQITGCRFVKSRPPFLRQENGYCLELDGYCPKLNIAFEYNGLQHYKDVRFTTEAVDMVIARDNSKREMCQKAGVTLITVPYWYDYKCSDHMRSFLEKIFKDYISICKNVLFIDEHGLTGYLQHTYFDLPSCISANKIKISSEAFILLQENIDSSTMSIMVLLDKFKTPLISLPDNIDREYDLSIDDNSCILNNEIKTSKKGVKFLNYFMLEVMIDAKRNNRPSYREAWNSMELREKLVRRMLKYDKCMNNGSLYGCFGCQYGRVYNFPFNVAKSLYNYFGAKNVLDFCAGYGGRLLGFWMSDAKSYVGIDPNRDIPYKPLIDYLEEKNKKSVTIIRECAENVSYELLQPYDFVFTSPPYFNTEIYSDDSNQSCHRYKTLEEWLNGFLFTAIKKVSTCLINGGHMAINIKDSNSMNIVEPMLKFIESLGLYEQLDPIKMIQPKRHKNNMGYEYIYIFRKIS